MESVESFRARAAAWIPEHLPRVGATGRDNPVTRRLDDEGKDPGDPVARAKALQRIIYDGGFAGRVLPVGVRRSGPHAAAHGRVQRASAAATTSPACRTTA